MEWRIRAGTESDLSICKPQQSDTLSLRKCSLCLVGLLFAIPIPMVNGFAAISFGMALRNLELPSFDYCWIFGLALA